MGLVRPKRYDRLALRENRFMHLRRCFIIFLCCFSFDFKMIYDKMIKEYFDCPACLFSIVIGRII